MPALLRKHSPVLIALGLLAAVPPALPQEAAPAPVDYARDVKPLLAKHCAACHGPDKQQAGFRTDTAKLAIQGGDIGPAIVPGKSGESRLIAAVSGTSDEVSRMPLDRPPLSEAEIDLLRRWIDAGAQHPDDEVAEPGGRIESDHWAFQPVVRPDVPRVQQQGRVRNAIDAFIQARLEQEGVKASDEADRVTLIRRLSLDLLGLLPSPAEVDAFLADNQPGAYERLVERLLASPHYGERWGRHWLDAARYADSNGFTIDGPRMMWPYRDWVIEAVNRDLPFDEFTIEQLAGDLLPGATTEQIVATGFHRNTLANEEGGTDDEQFRVENVVDRVGTTGTVWMALTIGCAQCHDHKYDPVTQRDFYRVFAVFNSTADNNDAAGLGPKQSLPDPAQAVERDRISAEIAAAEKEKTELERTLLERMAEWQEGLTAVAGEVRWETVPPADARATSGVTLRVLDDQSLLVEGQTPEHDVYDVAFTSPLRSVSAIRLEVLPHESLPKQGPGLASNGNFVLTEVELFLRPEGAEAGAAESDFRQKLVDAVADHAQENYPIAHTLDGDLTTGWAINVKGGMGSMNVRRAATFFPQGPLASTESQRWTFRLRHETPVNPKYQIGRFRLSVTDAPVAALLLSDEVRQLLATPADQRTKEQQERLRTVYLQGSQPWRDVAGRVDAARRRLDKLNQTIPTTLVMKELDRPRESFVHIRGDFLRRGTPVAPGVPGVLPELNVDDRATNRLDLARWLVDPQHPLTARVTVNRVWQRFFGVGLVETENDFGVQGTPPTHPELLDWLAFEFVRREWSVKDLQRLIVTSAAYRQSSALRDDLAQRDPANKLLARQSRVRLEAEVVRDACLSASGLLSERQGGPPVYPPQPDGVYALTQNKKNWTESQGEDRYRRGLYTYFWRSAPHPLMPTFDAPDANFACTRRVRSNTPLQALTLANDRGFMELAQGLAARILTEGPDYDDGRIRHGFRCALGREPGEAEASRLATFLATQRERFAADAAAAKVATPAALPEGIGPAEAAAWTALARVLLNLDEFITRE
jgi:mono/diheme cytochrome c family protein